MTAFPGSLKRFAAAPWLMLMVLLLVACESSQLPPWITGAKAPPAATAPRPQATTSAPARVPEAAPAGTVRPSVRPGVPSLAPLLSRPGIAVPGAAGEWPAMPLLPPSGVPRVGLLLPLTGPQAGIGKSLLNAAQLALFDFADEKFELLVHDTKGTEDGAAEAMAMAIGDGASIVLGPLLAASVKAVMPASQAAGVPVIAFSSDRSVAGEGVFTMGFFPEAGVRRVVAYARSRGVLRFAAMVPDDIYGERVLAAFRQAVEAVGGLVTNLQYYDPQTQDFADAVRNLAQYESRRQALVAQRAELEKRGGEVAQRALQRLQRLETIGDLPFEALLIADGGKRLQAIAAHLPFFDIDPARVRMLGTGQWDEAGIGAEPALIGGWFAVPDPATRAAFEKHYAEAYGKAPPRLATLAYDATALAAVLAGAEGAPDFSLAALTAPAGFFGRDGIFRFRNDGVVERGLAVLEVQRQGVRVLDKAPDVFGPAIF